MSLSRSAEPTKITGVAGLDELAVETDPAGFDAAAEKTAAVCTLAPSEPVRFKDYPPQDPRPSDSKSRNRVLAAGGYEAPPLRLYALQGVGFFGGSGLFAVGDRIVQESTSHWTTADPGSPEAIVAELRERMGRPVLAFDAPPRRLEGTYLLAASLYSRNYYHWTQDLLPTASLLAMRRPLAGLKALVDRRNPVADASLVALGLRPEDIVVLPKDRAVVVERLLFASTILHQAPRIHPLAVQGYDMVRRGLAPPSPTDGRRRLFASRGASDLRRLVNREAVEAGFARAGFAVVDPGSLDFAGQVSLFDSADVVVGEHGANLTNIGFCRPGTLVVELFHPSVPGEVALSYVAISEMRRLTHRSILGEARGDDRWSLYPQGALALVDEALRTRGDGPQGVRRVADAQ